MSPHHLNDCCNPNSPTHCNSLALSYDEAVNQKRAGETRTILTIACRVAGNTDSMNGKIDDLRIYDYALSEAEALYLASDGTGQMPVPSDAELFSAEAVGSKQIDFKDYCLLVANEWFKEYLWPTE